MRTDVIRTYKDVHTWVGIVSGLALFIAFYAGAITMFEKPLERWATPPAALAPAPPLQDAPRLVEAVLAAHPEAARGYVVPVTLTPDLPARMVWQVGGTRRTPGTAYGASFAADGSLQVARLERASVAEWIDVLHQQVGLPFAHAVSMPIMGAVALLYGIALVSGVIVLLPTLVKDFFALRLGKNLKRMWLDVHNALGMLSLPFHIVMTLTAVVFAFHDQFYDLQEKVVYERPVFQPPAAPAAPPVPAGPALAPAELVARAAAQAPEFRVEAVHYAFRDGVAQARVEGIDPRFATRGRVTATVGIDPRDGRLDTEDLPGRLPGWDTAVASFFTLHFGSFGGAPVRWAYFLLGLAGAFLFYSGNLLWIESRRKRQRSADPVAQPRSTRVMGSLTVGVALGCIAGISVSLAAAKWLPALVADAGLWHRLLYYAVFLAAVAWAFLRGAARGARELLIASAVATALIPLGSLAALCGLGGWNHGGAAPLVDATAAAGALALAVMARLARRRARTGIRDSVWSATPPASAETCGASAR